MKKHYLIFRIIALTVLLFSSIMLIGCVIQRETVNKSIGEPQDNTNKNTEINVSTDNFTINESNSSNITINKINSSLVNNSINNSNITINRTVGDNCSGKWQSTCTDSDGGINIYVKGSAVTKDDQIGNIIHISEDNCAIKQYLPQYVNGSLVNATMDVGGYASCSGDTCDVEEGYCTTHCGGIDASQYIKCPNGCKNGACIQP